MKSEPKVEEIKITSENRRELELELKRTMTAEGKNRALKKYAGGICSTCGELPTKKITYDADGVLVIERYCDKHFERQRL